ncbi:hypothetical protein, partial [Bradyrhizobium sp.]|uniref:hypothetical protein n=1 Tax=Bradyrhizobium sp. TaxID=376 RepID=UPI003BB02DC9
MPEAEREKLAALQQRYSQLEALLPTSMNDFADLDADQLDAKLVDIELVTAEMMVINAAERAILEELE